MKTFDGLEMDMGNAGIYNAVMIADEISDILLDRLFSRDEPYYEEVEDDSIPEEIIKQFKDLNDLNTRNSCLRYDNNYRARAMHRMLLRRNFEPYGKDSGKLVEALRDVIRDDKLKDKELIEYLRKCQKEGRIPLFEEYPELAETLK